MREVEQEPALRLLTHNDSISELTDLLHRAYRPLADAGMRFLASHQDENTTRRRCSEGECWILEKSKRLVGTITWRPGGSCPQAIWYRRQDVAIFGQFAVAPELQGRGVGSRLLSLMESRAKERGFSRSACDTSERAGQLIAFYTRKGYSPVEHVQWEETNYRSVILSKTLTE
jgi:GNAT superfamily N-acetyltransferase